MPKVSLVAVQDFLPFFFDFSVKSVGKADMQALNQI